MCAACAGSVGQESSQDVGQAATGLVISCPYCPLVLWLSVVVMPALLRARYVCSPYATLQLRTSRLFSKKTTPPARLVTLSLAQRQVKFALRQCHASLMPTSRSPAIPQLPRPSLLPKPELMPRHPPTLPLLTRAGLVSPRLPHPQPTPQLSTIQSQQRPPRFPPTFVLPGRSPSDLPFAPANPLPAHGWYSALRVPSRWVAKAMIRLERLGRK
jgi:hypothetical protein